MPPRFNKETKLRKMHAAQANPISATAALPRSEDFSSKALSEKLEARRRRKASAPRLQGRRLHRSTL